MKKYVMILIDFYIFFLFTFLLFFYLHRRLYFSSFFSGLMKKPFAILFFLWNGYKLNGKFNRWFKFLNFTLVSSETLSGEFYSI